MPDLLLVMSGGALGAGARFAVGQVAPGSSFPWATLGVNIAGAALMGVLAGVLARQGTLGGSFWLFLGVGVLGGFTTFSAFSLDAMTLFGRGAYASASAYVVASVLGALAMFAGGFALARA